MGQPYRPDLVNATIAARLSCLGLPVQPPPKPRPIRTAALETGRNDPCPCGCGRKYKQHKLLEQR